MVYCSDEDIACWRRGMMLRLCCSKLLWQAALLSSFLLTAAASCFVKQLSPDCCSHGLALGSSFYILGSFLLYLLFMLLVLVNLYSYDLSLCWSWQIITIKNNDKTINRENLSDEWCDVFYFNNLLCYQLYSILTRMNWKKYLRYYDLRILFSQ